MDLDEQYGGHQIKASTIMPHSSGASDEEVVLEIYESCDALMRHGWFDVIDGLMETVDIERTTIVALLAMVSITSTAADRLPSRAAFVARVRAHIEKVRPIDAAELMRGFD